MILTKFCIFLLSLAFLFYCQKSHSKVLNCINWNVWINVRDHNCSFIFHEVYRSKGSFPLHTTEKSFFMREAFHQKVSLPLILQKNGRLKPVSSCFLICLCRAFPKLPAAANAEVHFCTLKDKTLGIFSKFDWDKRSHDVFESKKMPIFGEFYS